MATNDPSVVFLERVRIAFCQNLWRAGAGDKTDPNSTLRWTSTFILEAGKHDKEVAAIKAAMNHAAVKKWPDPAVRSAAAAWIKAKDKSCLHDGNLKAQYEGFAGNLFVSAASSKVAPTVINRDKSPVTENMGVIYAGCYVNAIVQVWVMDDPKNGKGLFAGLMGVQFSEPGAAFGGGAVASPDMFPTLADTGGVTDMFGAAGAAAAGAPAEDDIAF